MAPSKKESKIKAKKKDKIKFKNKNKVNKKRDKKYLRQSHKINKNNVKLLNKREEIVSNSNKLNEKLIKNNFPSEVNELESKLFSTVGKVNSDKPVLSQEEIAEINSRTVFVGNLPKSVSQRKLKRIFSKYGKVESARLRCSALNVSHLPRPIAISKGDFHPKATSVIGFVKFVNKSDVEEALKANGTVYDDHHLRVDRVDSDKTENTQNSVFLGNIPFDVADNAVRKLFEDCGEIDSVHIIRDSKTGIGKGFGYVNFKSQDAIELALKLNGALLNKRNIRVKRAVKRFAEKRQKERINEDVKTKYNNNNHNETDKITFRPKKPKEKKKKDDPVKAFQGRTVKDNSIKKKKSKKKLKKELSKKQLIEILAKN